MSSNMRNSVICISGLLIVALTGCEDFIAEDVSDQVVTLRAPADQASSEATELTFWWDALEANTGYRVQVVTPSFEQPTSLVLDTLVYKDQLTVALDSGQYAWHVRAEQASYRGVFSAPARFTITGRLSNE